MVIRTKIPRRKILNDFIMAKIKYLTINTDASFHPEHKVGGYAFWIVCDLFKITKDGNFKVEPIDSLEAEMMCIGNAIATLLSQDLPKIETIVINTDCIMAMNRIKNQSNPMGKKIKDTLNEVLKKAGGAKYRFKHVKAHNGTADARSFVNDWCDKEAKRRMRIAVGQKQRFQKKYPNIKIGRIVSHEDYSDEQFTVKSINYKTEIVETIGGKNGTWTNHASLIIL